MKFSDILNEKQDRSVDAKKEYEVLKKTSIQNLKDEVKRNYRVVDVKGADKWTLIGMIMEAKFGSKWDELIKKVE